MVGLLITNLLVACTSENNSNQKASINTDYKMDTLVKIKMYSEQEEKIIDKVWQRLDELEQKMSQEAGSEIDKINQAAGKEPVEVSRETYRVIKTGIKYAKLSEGALDPTIAPLVQLWGIGSDNPQVPSAAKINKKLTLVDYKGVKLYPDERKVFLTKKGMKLDVGGIAKGYAADEVVELLKEKGVKSGYISLGGNVSVLGTKPDGSVWTVGIQDPHQPRGEVMAGIELTDKTVVTSGNYERYFKEDGVRYHHILNPETGYPAQQGIISSTIIADNSIDADALSTAVYVLGVEKGLQLIENLSEVEAVVVTKDNKVYMTSNLKNQIDLLKDKYNFK